MKSKILNLLLLTTILLMHLEGVIAINSDEPIDDIPHDEDTTDPEEDDNSTTVRAPVPIGAVVVSIAVMLYMAYRGVEQKI